MKSKLLTVRTNCLDFLNLQVRQLEEDSCLYTSSWATITLPKAKPHWFPHHDDDSSIHESSFIPHGSVENSCKSWYFSQKLLHLQKCTLKWNDIIFFLFIFFLKRWGGGLFSGLSLPGPSFNKAKNFRHCNSSYCSPALRFLRRISLQALSSQLSVSGFKNRNRGV